MPSADPTSADPVSVRPTIGGASVERAGDALRFAGALLRADIAALWKQAPTRLEGVRRFDLAAVGRVDSAGVALLAELAERCGGVVIDGAPAGLAELRAAYRLTPALAFGTA
jgi:phospholipid transport system transporter-binding protein